MLDSGMQSTTVVSSGLLIIEGLKGANREVGDSKSFSITALIQIL